MTDNNEEGTKKDGNEAEDATGKDTIPAQNQDNVITDTNVKGDLIFAPVQIGTKIETQIVQVSASKITQQPLIKTSPYQGLKRFNFRDRDNFFGRDKLISQLIEAVNQSSLSLVIGASGSGKSSAVRAGLIPELKNTLSTNTFYDFIFTPGQCPFDAFYRCLRSEEKDYSFSEQQAKQVLDAKVDSLETVITQLQKPDERWFIFVDQFEELFTSCPDEVKRDNFIKGLVGIANSNNPSIKIVLAMRADFLEQFSAYPDLGKIINQGNLHLVTDMHKDELRQAIEQPAAKHGVVFEDGLVDQISKEIEGQKGYLPLLQYTLNLLWQSELKVLEDGSCGLDDRTLNKSSYAILEGVRGALQKQINTIYNGLDQEQKIATKQIFIKLVNIVETDSGSKAVSRRANLSEFSEGTIASTLHTFINENLLVSNAEKIKIQERAQENAQQEENSVNTFTQTGTVEISHEILLSSWATLKEWIEEEKDAIVLKNWLSGETNRWLTICKTHPSKSNDELLQGARLEQVSALRNAQAFDNLGSLRPEENAFIDASISWQLKKEKQKKNRRRNAFASMLIFTLVSLGLAGFSFVQLKKVEETEQLRQDELVGSSWASLQPSQINYQECDTWLEFGIRDLYCRIKPIMDYQKVKVISGLEVFRAGPHTSTDINFRGEYQFGYYNPVFLDWVYNEVIINPNDGFLKDKIQSAYNDKIRLVARAFYQTHLALSETKTDFARFEEKYREAQVNYRQLLASGQTNLSRFTSQPIDFYSIKERYVTSIEEQIVPADNIGFDLTEDCRYIADYLATRYEFQYDSIEERENYWYMSIVSGGFWVRRSIDGTDQQFVDILTKLLQTYDAEWLQETNRIAEL